SLTASRSATVLPLVTEFYSRTGLRSETAWRLATVVQSGRFQFSRTATLVATWMPCRTTVPCSKQRRGNPMASVALKLESNYIAQRHPVSPWQTGAHEFALAVP